jgi:O-antigen/teichoic acid export membrane protein
MNRQALREGVLWGISSKGLSGALGVLSSLALVRFLTPADMGIVGMVIAVIQGALLFRDGGLTSSIVSDRDHSQRLIDTGATAALGLGVFFFVGVLFLAPAMAAFLHEERLRLSIQIASVTLLASSLAFIHSAMAKKTFQFRYHYQPDVVSSLVNAVLSVGLAWAGWGYWSVVWGLLASSLVQTVLYYRLFPVPFQYRIDKACLYRIYSFSAYIQLNILFAFLLSHGIRLAVGKLIALDQLGYYHVAMRISSLPAEYIAPVIATMALPYFSRMMGEQMRQHYLETSRYLQMTVIPLSFLAGLAVEPLFLWLYEDTWLPVIPVLHILLIQTVMHAVLGPIAMYMYARRKPHVVTGFMGLQTGLVYAGILLLHEHLTIRNIAIVHTVATGLAALGWLLYLSFREEMPVTRLLRDLQGTLLISALAFGIVRELIAGLPMASWQALCVTGLLFPALIGGLYWRFYRTDIQRLASILRG